MTLLKKQVLVTGGAGFIGSHLVDDLIDQNADVTVIDDLSYGKRQNLNAKAEFIQCDIRDCDRIKQIIHNKELVFHLAASATSKESAMGWNNPVYDYEVNAVGTLNMLRSIAELGQGTKMVYASSAAVYGRPTYTPVDEEHSTNPISPYGVSKLTGEKYCFAFSSEYGVDCAVIRIFNTYGPRQPRYVMDDFIKKLKSDPSRLEIIGSGNQTRDFSYVSDTAKAFVLAGQDQTNGCQVYNVGTGISTSIKQLAETMISLIAPGAELVLGKESWRGDIKNIGPADIVRLQKLGFSPSVNLTKGLEALIKWHERMSDSKQGG